jgi:hypothetical protein
MKSSVCSSNRGHSCWRRFPRSPQRPPSSAISVSGRVELDVSTGSGNIHLTRGAGNQIHIFGQGQVQQLERRRRARACAKSPPIPPSSRQATSSASAAITRTGTISASTMRFRRLPPRSSTPAPARATSMSMMSATTPSSPPAPATSTPPAFTAAFRPPQVQAISYAEQTGEGDVKAETGSGNIELREPPRRPACPHRLRQYQIPGWPGNGLETRHRFRQHRILARR